MILALDDKRVQLELRNTSDLMPHEETIGHLSKELESAMVSRRAPEGPHNRR